MTITIVSTADGSLDPNVDKFPNTVTNGDFLITGNEIAWKVGDGSDEKTEWKFDFTGESGLASFTSEVEVTSALLSLVFTPRSGDIYTDTVRIEGLPIIIAPEIQGAVVNKLHSVELELLDQEGYTSSGILEVLLANGGKIPMVYADDSVVSSAKLELTQKLPAYQYATKFVCGESKGEVVAPGKYYTAINVHNPQNSAARISKTISVALPGQEAGPVSSLTHARLAPNEAFEIDCSDIFKQSMNKSNSRLKFLKGFVTIFSDEELDVVAVYTAAGKDKQVETFHSERVPARKITTDPGSSKLPDLVPVPDPRPGYGFCRLVGSGLDKGKLQVTVKNQGNGPAEATTTRVTFSNDGFIDVYTPAIPAGGSVDLPPLSFPMGCYSPDCHFEITVDAKNQLVEVNKANNTGSGMCLG